MASSRKPKFLRFKGDYALYSIIFYAFYFIVGVVLTIFAKMSDSTNTTILQLAFFIGMTSLLSSLTYPIRIITGPKADVSVFWLLTIFFTVLTGVAFIAYIFYFPFLNSTEKFKLGYEEMQYAILAAFYICLALMVLQGFYNKNKTFIITYILVLPAAYLVFMVINFLASLNLGWFESLFNFFSNRIS